MGRNSRETENKGRVFSVSQLETPEYARPAGSGEGLPVPPLRLLAG